MELVLKHAEVITIDEENSLWTGVLGTQSPKALLAAVFYSNVLSDSEHDASSCHSSSVYVYTENGSKNHSGRNELPNKPIFACRDAGDRCHVHLLDLYISRMPKKAKDLDYPSSFGEFLV